MFSFVKDFKSSCENIHKSMPGRGELVLFSSLRAGEKTGSVSFRRSGLALGWVLAPGCRQTRVMEPHPGRTPESIPSGARRRAGCPGRRWEPRAEAACCAGASATAALRGSILSLRGDWSTAGGGLESAVRAGETESGLPWVWKADKLGRAASAQPGVICGSRCAPSLWVRLTTKAARAGPGRSIFGERFIISIYEEETGSVGLRGLPQPTSEGAVFKPRSFLITNLRLL